ncbi:C-type mannose receptor 2-like [Pempheris klunzingeri]|uniref:C-type mannose receptor 2-like n=1 Tax=Pempheris klunzingeri TaxID=3127111 RepID=UPI0039814DAC
MTEAQSYCREQYTDLATIHSMKDVDILNNVANLSRMVYSEDSYRAWIGLYDDLDSWRWSLSNTSFYKYGEKEFRRWASGEPNNEKGNERCTQIYHDGRWNDVNCDTPLKAVCFDVQGPNVTFVLINISLSWPEAQSYCREHHTDLASVRTMAENQRVKELLGPGEEVWIGLFRESWKWSDGSNSSFRYWSLYEPNNYYGNEMCVMADFGNSGKWEDWSCDKKTAFICYRDGPVSQKVINVRLKKSSSLDLNDPAVTEDILKKLRRRLKDQGVNKGVRLSWKKQADGKVFHRDDGEAKKRRKKDEL